MRKQLESYIGWCAKTALLREKPHIVAIVGSVGKSSVRYAMELALEAVLPKGSFRVSRKNYNNELGLPLSVFDLDAPGSSVLAWLRVLWTATAHAIGMKGIGVEKMVLEMAADHPGDIAYLCRIAPPDSVIITALGPEHTEFFGNAEKAIAEERTALKGVSEGGEVILNADDAEAWASRSMTVGECIGYGYSPEACVRIERVGVVADVNVPAEAGLEVTVNALGNHVHTLRLKGVYGVAHAYAVAAAFAFLESRDHLTADAVRHVEAGYAGMPGRARLLAGVRRTWILDDSYNAQPQAMAAAIRDLAVFPVIAGAKRIAALGDMRELGPLTDEEHRRIGRLVAESGIDVLVCCGTLAAVIAEAAEAAGMAANRIRRFPDSREAGYAIQQDILTEGDAVLVKGSQSSRMERVTKELMADPTQARTLLVRQTGEWQK